MYAKKDEIKSQRKRGTWAELWTHLIFALSCLWMNSAVRCACRCFYAPSISLHPLRFCNSCVYTTLALVRSLAFSSNKTTNIPFKSQALASRLSFPWRSFLQTPKKLGSATSWPPVTAKEFPEITGLCRTRGGNVFVLESIQQWKELFFELFQTLYKHSCNLAEMGL